MNFKSQIKIPSNVSLSLKGGYVRVLGPLGESKTRFLTLDPKGKGKISKLTPREELTQKGENLETLLLSFMEDKKGKKKTLTEQPSSKRGDLGNKLLCTTNNLSSLPTLSSQEEDKGEQKRCVVLCSEKIEKLSVSALEHSSLHHLSLGKQTKHKDCENSLHISSKGGNTGSPKETKRGTYVDLLRKIVSNKIQGVSSGFALTLKTKGVGFRVKKNQKGDLVFKMGLSHQVEYQLPESVFAFVFQQTVFCLFGLDKNQVSQVAHKIQEIRQPDIYKGKGIRFATQEVKVKQGKRK